MSEMDDLSRIMRQLGNSRPVTDPNELQVLSELNDRVGRLLDQHGIDQEYIDASTLVADGRTERNLTIQADDGEGCMIRIPDNEVTIYFDSYPMIVFNASPGSERANFDVTRGSRGVQQLIRKFENTANASEG